MPGPRHHRYERDGENQQGEGLRQESEPVGTDKEEQPRSASSRLTLPSATGRLLRPFVPPSVSVLFGFVVIIYSFRDRSPCVPATARPPTAHLDSLFGAWRSG
jgi:hypothetical protein